MKGRRVCVAGFAAIVALCLGAVTAQAQGLGRKINELNGLTREGGPAWIDVRGVISPPNAAPAAIGGEFPLGLGGRIWNAEIALFRTRDLSRAPEFREAFPVGADGTFGFRLPAHDAPNMVYVIRVFGGWGYHDCCEVFSAAQPGPVSLGFSMQRSPVGGLLPR